MHSRLLGERYKRLLLHPDPDLLVTCAWFGNMDPLRFHAVFFDIMMFLRGSGAQRFTAGAHHF